MFEACIFKATGAPGFEYDLERFRCWKLSAQNGSMEVVKPVTGGTQKKVIKTLGTRPHK